MKISLESEASVRVFGFLGTVAYYQAAPIHEIFLRAVVAEPGIRVSGLVKKFGLPTPACRRLLHPLLASGVLRISEAASDFAVEAKNSPPVEGQLPVHLLMDDWLLLVLAKPFYNHHVLGVIPAGRFPVDRRELEPNASLAEFHGSHFSASGTYAYQLGGGKSSDRRSLRQGVLIDTLPGSTAFLGSQRAKIIEDAHGSRLTLNFAGQRLAVDLMLSSPVIRPDLETFGQLALRQQNFRLGHPAAHAPILRKRFQDLDATEKLSARGSLSEPVRDVRVSLHDIPIMPHSEACYHTWLHYLFSRQLETHGYAQTSDLRRHLDSALATITTPTFPPPTVDDLISRLKGKGKMLARALADWPSLTS